MKMCSTINRSSNNSDLKCGESDSDADPESRKKHSFVERIESTVSEYTRRSTIHGISYIGDDERHPLERLWWFNVFVCSVFCASYLIYQAYKTMSESPIIESPSLNSAPMWDVPFPAITFCPMVMGLTPFGLNKTNWPEFAQKLLPDDLKASPLHVANFLLQRSHEDNYDILAQVFPEINIHRATWFRNGEQIRVTLDKTITNWGPCRTFNMYREKDLVGDGVILSSPDGNITGKKQPQWSRESVFRKELPLDHYTYPFRSFCLKDKFFIGFNVNQSERILQYYSIIKIFIHAPDELPLTTRHSNTIVIDADKYSVVQLTPHVIESKGIENYKPSVRRCYYAAERQLKFYKFYTQNSCESECSANFTLAYCGCVPYKFPHFNDTKICVDRKCFIEAHAKLNEPEFIGETNYTPMDDCDCLPTCTQLSYALQVTNMGNATQFMNMKSNLSVTNWLEVKFKSPFFKKDIRSELHSLSEFFSNSGGSLGLFLGVSIFSIIELFYFSTVRLYLRSRNA